MPNNRVVFTVTLGELAEVPGTPFAYWAPKSLRDLFQKFPPLDRDVAKMKNKQKIADVKVGLQTSDDLRFTRYHWEVPVEKIATSREETFQGKKWVPFAKGGKPFYHDIQLVVNWENNGQEIKSFRDAVGRLLSRPQNESFYFRAGLAWINKMSWSAASGFERLNVYWMPIGTIFACGYHAIFTDNEKKVWNLLAWARSRLIAAIIPLIDPNVQNVGVGIVARLPIYPEVLFQNLLFTFSQEAHDRLREWATGDETTTVFVAPWILQVWKAVRLGKQALSRPVTGHPLSRDFEWRYGISDKALEFAQNALRNGFSLFALAQACTIWESELRKRIDEIQREIDDEVYRLYGISDEDRALIEAELSRPIETEEEGEEETLEGETFDEQQEEPEVALTAEEHIKRLVHYLAHQAIKEDPDGIVPLQDCYPAGKSELERGLPYRVREKLREIFGEEALPIIERELREALGKSLDDWLATDFFGYHVGLYRLRPIIWQIVPPSNSETQRSRKRTSGSNAPLSFSTFIYWHKLDSDTLHKIRHLYLQPFLDASVREVQRLEQQVSQARNSGISLRQLADLECQLERARAQERTLEALAERIDELFKSHNLKVESRSEWVKAKVNEIVQNGYVPNLDYGVRVNIEPLKQKGILPRDAERVKG